MRRFEDHIIVNAPPEKIFDYFADFTRHSEWAKYPITITKVTDGPVGVGTKFASEAKQFGTQKDTVTITEYTPPKKLVYESVGAAGTIRHWITLREDTGSTMVMKGSEIVAPTFLIKLTMPVVNRAQPKMLAQDLARIKAAVEGSAG